MKPKNKQLNKALAALEVQLDDLERKLIQIEEIYDSIPDDTSTDKKQKTDGRHFRLRFPLPAFQSHHHSKENG